MASSIQRIITAINADETLPDAQWLNTGGGCMAIEVRLGTDTDESHILIGDYGDGPFGWSDYDNDDNLSGAGFGITRYDAEGEWIDKPYDVFHAPTVEEVVAEVRNIARYFAPTAPKTPEMVTKKIVLEVTYDKHRVTPEFWALQRLNEVTDVRVVKVEGVGHCGRCA